MQDGNAEYLGLVLPVSSGRYGHIALILVPSVALLVPLYSGSAAMAGHSLGQHMQFQPGRLQRQQLRQPHLSAWMHGEQQLHCFQAVRPANMRLRIQRASTAPAQAWPC